MTARILTYMMPRLITAVFSIRNPFDIDIEADKRQMIHAWIRMGRNVSTPNSELKLNPTDRLM